ncbi:H-NS family nucleoid-associated regulatory protein [uncultured Endozoicomonas sp.]|uniref:H-NS family histone-like protein n=1 Tax=uncultured Endozoicomonas sp. TaxID=432652 RepID=UPI00260B9A12|nr:H-NS family nucleoid-associated regulatory protein [uncultured Endozoicomonas sp.]
MNIFDEAISVLKSKVQVRKLLQDLHAEDIQRIISRLEAIHEEKMLAQLEIEEEQARKKAAMDAVKEKMKELGLSVNDIKGLAEEKAPSARKGKVRQRYVFNYEATDGSVVNWEGATTGRIPADFSAYLERTGKDRKACIVSEL